MLIHPSFADRTDLSIVADWYRLTDRLPDTGAFKLARWDLEHEGILRGIFDRDTRT